eukprot:m.26400 g.26400  ORF g.26400 m.26400 type:complete len:394 (+) comp8826_c0_seq3:149-1330(+)
MVNLKVKYNKVTHELADMELSMEVSGLRAKIAELVSLEKERLRLVCSGHVLKDSRTLESYNLKDGSVIIAVEVKGAKGAPPTPSTPAASVFQDTPAAPTRQAGTRSATETPSGSSSSSGSGSGADRFRGTTPAERQQALQQLFSNPQALMQMLQSPAFANTPMAQMALRDPNFQRLLQDPEALMELQQMLQSEGAGSDGPPVSRDLFDQAIRCMNGEPLPPGSQQVHLQDAAGNPVTVRIEVPAHLRSSGSVASAVSSSSVPAPGATSAPPPSTGPFREIVSRADIAAALRAALGDAAKPASSGPASAQPAATSATTSNEPPAAAPDAGDPAPAQDAAPQAQGGDGSDDGGDAQQYAAQLQQLRDMGFADEAQCLQALRAAGGDVNTALQFLF